MTRDRAKQRWQVNVCFAIVAAYAILSMVLWLQVLAAVNEPSAVWVVMLLVLLIASVLLGLLPQGDKDEGSQSRTVWTIAAALRRPYRDIDLMRKKYAKKAV
jgi:uncharacterized membrane protein YeiB